MRLTFLKDSLLGRGIKWEDATIAQQKIIPMSVSSVRYYAGLLFGERIKDGYSQTYRRFEALVDKYNMINFCCVIRGIFGIAKLPPSIDPFFPSGVDTRCVFNHDGSSVFLLDPERIKDTLVAPSGTISKMKRKGFGPSSTKASGEAHCTPRSLQYNMLVNADGSFIGVCFVIRDSSFPSEGSQFHDLSDGIFVLLVHTLVTAWIIDEILMKSWCEPLVDKFVADLKVKDAKTTLIPTSFHDLGHKIPLGDGSSSVMPVIVSLDSEDDLPPFGDEEPQLSKDKPTAATAAAAPKFPPAKKPKKEPEPISNYRVIIFFDGKQEQVNICQFWFSKDKELAKSNGSCSMIVQALDKCTGFETFRRNMESDEMRRIWSADTSPAMSPLMMHLNNILSGTTGFGSGMALNSRRTYVYAFRLIPKYLSESFTPAVIRAGWAKAFILPFDQRGALTLNDVSAKKDVNEDLVLARDMDALYRFIETKGYPEVMKTGSVTDATMEMECGAIVGRPPARGSSLPVIPSLTVVASAVVASAPSQEDNVVTFSTQSTLQKCNSSRVKELQNAAVPKAPTPLEEMPLNQRRFTWVTHPVSQEDRKTQYIKKMREEVEKNERKIKKDQKKALEQSKPQASKSALPQYQSNHCMMSIVPLSSQPVPNIFHDAARSKDDVGWWLCQTCYLWMCPTCNVEYKEKHQNFHTISKAQNVPVTAVQAITSHESAVTAAKSNNDAPMIASILHTESPAGSVLPSAQKTKGTRKPRPKKPRVEEDSKL